MPRQLTLVTFAAFALLGGTLAFSQQMKPQKIRFEGTSEYSFEELSSVTGLKTGQTYTSDEVNKRAQQLLATGIFDKVAYKFDGIDLVFSLNLNPQLFPILLANLPLDGGAELDAKLRTRLPLFHSKVPADGTALDDVRSALENMLAQEGIQAQLQTSTSGVARTHQVNAIKFAIPSPPVKTGAIRLEGVSSEMAPRVTSFAQHLGGNYETDRTEQKIERNLQSLYEGEGYAAAKITVSQSEKPVVAVDVIRVPLEVAIIEGRTYKLGTVAFAGDIPFSQKDLEVEVGLRSRFTPEGVYVRVLESKLESRFKSKGYLDVVVTSQVSLDEQTGIANYSIEAQPGPVYHVGFVKFEGVDNSLRALLMRNWQMLPGDPFDENYVGLFMFNAQKGDEALRRAVTGLKATYDVQADPESHDVNLIIRLEKQ